MEDTAGLRPVPLVRQAAAGRCPIRILEVVNCMDRAGIETLLMNHYRRIDRSVVQLDFLTHRSREGDYDEEIRGLGGRVYYAPRLYPQNWLVYRRWMRTFFLAHPYYRVVHSHIDEMSALPLAAAKQAGVPVRIAHAHASSNPAGLKYPVRVVARRLLPYVATNMWACSQTAGQYLFGADSQSEVRVVPNAIDISRFRSSLVQREETRRILGLGSKQLVIGNVARFDAVKNHVFLVRLMRELVSRGTDAVLVLAGTGPLEQRIRKAVKEAGLSDRVRFLGARDDIPVVLQAFDIFVLPSFSEGIPLSLIEAQASGLPLLVSEGISAEALIATRSERIGLDLPLQVWVDAVHDLVGSERQPVESSVRLRSAGYDVEVGARRWQDAYVRYWNEGAL